MNPKKDKIHELRELMRLWYAGETSDSQEYRLGGLLDELPEQVLPEDLRAEADTVRTILLASAMAEKAYSNAPVPDPEKMLAKIFSESSLFCANAESAPTRKRKPFTVWLSALASVAAIIAVALLWFNPADKAEPELQPRAILQGFVNTQKISLPKPGDLNINNSIAMVVKPEKPKINQRTARRERKPVENPNIKQVTDIEEVRAMLAQIESTLQDSFEDSFGALAEVSISLSEVIQRNE